MYGGNIEVEIMLHFLQAPRVAPLRVCGAVIFHFRLKYCCLMNGLRDSSVLKQCVYLNSAFESLCC